MKKLLIFVLLSLTFSAIGAIPANYPDIAAATFQPFPYIVTTSGLTVTLNASSILWNNGSSSTVASQTIPLYASATQYVGIDVFDQSLHNYPRALDMGTKWVAKIVTDASGATSVTYLAQDQLAPPHRFEAVKQKIIGGTNMIKVAIIGDSISGPYPTYTTNWVQALFSQSSWAPNAYIPHTATNWYVTNYAIGTQTPVMGMTTIGTSVDSPVVGGDNNLGGNFGYADGYYSDLITGGGSYPSPVISSIPDLVIVGYYNPTTPTESNYIPMMERIIQRLRGYGISVIVHDDNPDFNVSSTQYFERGPALKQAADQHGAMYIDTSARSYEYHILYTNTPTMNADAGLHPNDLGQQLFAKWFRSALAPNSQNAERISASPVIVNLAPGTYSQYTYPANMEIEFAINQAGNSGTYNTNIAYTDASVFNKANPAIYIGNKSVSTGALAVPSGSALNFTHPCATYLALLVDGTCVFNWTLNQGSTVVASGVWSGVGARPAICELANTETLRGLSSSAYNHGVSDFWVNAGWKLSVTSGQAIIYGVVVGAPARRSIPLQGMEFVGGWTATNIYGANWQSSTATNTYKTNNLIPARATDNTGDYVKIPFTGAGIQLLLESGIAAGQYTVWLNGRQITTLNGNSSNPLEGYLGAARTLPINVMVQSLGYNDANYISSSYNVLKISMSSVGASAALNAPTNMLRRFKVLGASVIGPPDWIR